MRPILPTMIFAAALLSFGQIAPANPSAIQSQVMVDGLEDPWGFDFLPNGDVLISQQEGDFVLVSGTKRRTFKGPQDVIFEGQGGLLDVLIPSDFQTSRQVLYTYSKKQGKGSGTALGQATFNKNMTRLGNHKTLFEIANGSKGGRHFGSRIAEGEDGKIYVSIGDRGDRPSAQDLSRENGSILRLNRDGTVPKDNPFENSAIWSSGHRNPQGLTFAPDGKLIAIEHGPKGGDEVNFVEKGKNYGWPVISYGRHYSGAKVGVGNAKAGMEQPFHYWDPSIAPSGALVYSGKLWPNWTGQIMTGSLKFDQIQVVSSKKSEGVIAILQNQETLRVRDIAEADDGSIWFLSQPNGQLVRITPH